MAASSDAHPLPVSEKKRKPSFVNTRGSHGSHPKRKRNKIKKGDS